MLNVNYERERACLLDYGTSMSIDVPPTRGRPNGVLVYAAGRRTGGACNSVGEALRVPRDVTRDLTFRALPIPGISPPIPERSPLDGAYAVFKARRTVCVAQNFAWVQREIAWARDAAGERARARE